VEQTSRQLARIAVDLGTENISAGGRPPHSGAQSQMPTMRLEMLLLLLRAIDSYESRHGRDPTVVELVADLGIPSDFGHSQLVGRLRHQISAGFVSHHGGRIGLTRLGRLTCGIAA
jgi:hypothetical protein